MRALGHSSLKRDPRELKPLGAPERTKSLDSSSSQDELVVESCNGCTDEGSNPEDPLQDKITKRIKHPLQSKWTFSS